MASSVTPAHAPAVNHPTQRLAGFSATHSRASEHFTTDAITHGSERHTAAANVPNPPSGWVNSGDGYLRNADPTNASYQDSYNIKTGVYSVGDPYTNQTTTTVSGAGPTSLAAAQALFQKTFGTQGGVPMPVAPAPAPAPAPGAKAPFDTLASLLTQLSGQTPVAATVPADTVSSSVPTTSGPSLVIPLLLVLLACGVGYWWYAQHHKKHAPAAAH